MDKYGVTPTGYVPKRADEIKESINAALKEGWGYDVAMNPQSVLQVLVTGISDEIAALWEQSQEKYYNLYPSSAEGISLDNAMQFGGVLREADRRTVYSLKCTGHDGTVIPYGTKVLSDTQPQKTFVCYTEQEISKNNFREILLTVYGGYTYYALTINGDAFSYVPEPEEEEETPPPASVEDVLDYFVDNVHISGIVVEKTEDLKLRIYDTTGMSSNILVTSENIMVEECVSNILFESEEYGAVVIPDGFITKLYSNVDGFLAVTNDISPVLGRLEASDIEARQEYIKRCMTRSSNMLESIVSSLYSVTNVTSVKGYENDQDTMDSDGRPGHCIEIVIDGGDDSEIADVIYNKKASGIYSFGSKRFPISDEYGNIHDIGFNRPVENYVWLKVTLTAMDGTQLPANYAAAVQNIILNNAVYDVGEYIKLQSLYTPIYNGVNNVVNIDIRAFVTQVYSKQPEDQEYTLRNIELGIRDKAVFEKSRIKVVVQE